MRNSLVVVFIAVSATLFVPVAHTPIFAQQQAAPAADPHATDELAAERQALGFLGYLDNGRFADSYAYTGMLIRAQADRASYASQVEKARQGTGAILTRALMDASYQTSVPGAPDGQYVVLHYRTSFADRQEAVEMLMLALAKGYWWVSGYYIK